MTISAETHILVGDVAFAMADECHAAWRKNRDMPNYFAAGWLYSEGFRQSLIGIGMGLDNLEKHLADNPL